MEGKMDNSALRKNAKMIENATLILMVCDWFLFSVPNFGSDNTTRLLCGNGCLDTSQTGF